LWQRITNEQLRELPDEQACREIFTRGVETRKIKGDLSISVYHPVAKVSESYDLRDMPGILVGQEVNVQPVLLGGGAKVKVSYLLGGETYSEELSPIEYDSAGFDVNAPVFGKNYARPPDTLREKNWKQLEIVAKELEGKLIAHSDIAAHQPFLRQRVGTVIDVVQREEILLSATEFTKRVKARCGNLPEGFLNSIKARYPEGVPHDLVEDYSQEVLSGKAANF
jgi:hypothetical protein